MSLYAKRIERVLAELKTKNLSHMIVCDLSSIWYLTGIRYNPMERFFALYLDASGHHKLFLNRLFVVPKTGLEEVWLTDTDNVTDALAREINLKANLGIDKNWPARFLLPLMNHNPQVQYTLASECIDRVRAQKDETERELMRAASRLNDLCLAQALDFIKPGLTEQDLAHHISALFKAGGASGNSFDPLVAFGANAADPHHHPDDTVLKEGDCILIDMGCELNGYCSDMTRTYFYKTASPKAQKIHDIVREANEKAQALIKPGVRFCDIDSAARDHIAKHGYGEFFTHRLGHSIGIDCHEWGDVSQANTEPIKEHQCFSIEPGIYLPGELGVRVEDLVIVTHDGCEIINRLPKNWRIIG